jgi:hypothetical protein
MSTNITNYYWKRERKKSLHSDGQVFHQYQLSEQSPLTGQQFHQYQKNKILPLTSNLEHKKDITTYEIVNISLGFRKAFNRCGLG